ncbi:BQ2448_1964 [Microbotryum intermedium]|uniref:BQ2448_1964 protein n=1 Tax=Microbotryum intermedium TaxID=269621 RepID=A0A238FAN4_9BASI|nr:BQ2448_1964 [Microbotryum intermedium]
MPYEFAAPTTFQDLLTLSFLSRAYPVVNRKKTERPPPDAIRRFPGETGPSQPLMCASHDSDLVDRVISSFERDLGNCQIPLDTSLPKRTTEYLNTDFIRECKTIKDAQGGLGHLRSLKCSCVNSIIKEIRGPKQAIKDANSQIHLGQRGSERNLVVGNLSGAKTANKLLDSYQDSLVINGVVWPALGSQKPIEMRIINISGPLDRRLCGSSAIAAKLPGMKPRGRFAIIYGAPYFVLAQLVVVDGFAFLLISDLHTSTSGRDSSAATTKPLLAVLTSLFPDIFLRLRSYIRNARVERSLRSTWNPSVSDVTSTSGSLSHEAVPFICKNKVSWKERQAVEEVCAAPDPASSKLGLSLTFGSASDQVVVKLKHLPNTQASRSECGVPRMPARFMSVKRSRLVAAKVELECGKTAPEGTTSRLNLLKQHLPSHLREWDSEADREAAMTWIARMSNSITTPGLAAEPNASTSRGTQAPYMVKVVPSESASVIVVEYFVYTQIVPTHSPIAQSFFAKLHGLYRSGADGHAYLTSCTIYEIVEADGLYQPDEQPIESIVRRADGRLCAVDWIEAKLKSPEGAH